LVTADDGEATYEIAIAVRRNKDKNSTRRTE
jgi:hypothetical protein